MTLRLAGSTSGYTEIDAPAVAGSNTLVLPTGNGTADQVLATNGSGALSWATRNRMVLATAQNTTSGTNIDFTGIPSWVCRVTVMLNGVSTSGASNPLVQIGAGSILATGYAAASGLTQNAASGITASYTTGLGIASGNGTNPALHHGSAILALMGSNVWTFQSSISAALNDRCFCSSGSKALSGTLDRIRITTVNGTGTFDAGSVNILYEG